MKKFYLNIFLFLIIGIESCNEVIDEVIPDVTTVLTKTFQIRIYKNTDLSKEETIDITSSGDYNSFKNTVKGYELSKITYQIKNDNVPEDMYFSGEVICKNEEGTQTFSVGNIAAIKISEGAGFTSESDVNEKLTNIDYVMGWLKTPGRFKVVSSYSLTDPNNSPYQITSTIAGSNFELIIRFYIIVKTGI